MEKPGANRSWRLVGTVAEGILCHKPCTVSGGGKSEISKPITDAILTGPVFVADFKKDFDQVAELIERDYGGRFNDPARMDQRPILSAERSLGSVIKLLTPDDRTTRPEYNAWLESIPQYLKELVFVVKRYYKPEWGANWRDHFSVDIINGKPANELKCDNRKLVTTYLRVGFDADGSWRTFGLRKDFYPAMKIQAEDDITASVVVPPGRLRGSAGPGRCRALRLKFVQNTETRLFQRPDDAIHRGYDKQTEADFARPDNFFSNYEPLPGQGRAGNDRGRDRFSPVHRADAGAHPQSVADGDGAAISSAPPIRGSWTASRPRTRVTCRSGPTWSIRVKVIWRKWPRACTAGCRPDGPLHNPVAAVLPGRRNNPPEAGIRSLAFTIRFIISSCRSCSWNSSAA